LAKVSFRFCRFWGSGSQKRNGGDTDFGSMIDPGAAFGALRVGLKEQMPQAAQKLAQKRS
jgi:hypothetical protein